MSSSTEVKAASKAGPAFRLIYRSHSKLPSGTDRVELGNILRKSRTNNAARGVTGALLMYDDWFAQVLEGPEETVRTLYERISRDPRHDTVEVREEGAVEGRVFAKWAMANVGEHGEADISLIPAANTVVEGAPRRTATTEQEAVLVKLRDMTRGYGRGS